MTEPWPTIECESCNSEFGVDPVGDTETIEVKFCPYCGEALDNDMDLSNVNFDLNDDYD